MKMASRQSPAAQHIPVYNSLPLLRLLPLVSCLKGGPGPSQSLLADAFLTAIMAIIISAKFNGPMCQPLADADRVRSHTLALVMAIHVVMIDA